MKRECLLGLLLTLALLAPASAQNDSNDPPTPSAHTSGPDGLEGWTLTAAIPDSGYGNERFALTLIIARRGQIVQRISGEAIIWKWIFWANGQQVAYETGPFHFGEACVLVDLSDGHELDRYDCYHDLPPSKPDWAKALEAPE